MSATTSQPRNTVSSFQLSEELEQRFCLGSMHAAVAEWSSETEPAEVNVLTEPLSDLSNRAYEPETSMDREDDFNATPSDPPDIHQRQLAASSATELVSPIDLESAADTGSSIQTDLASAIESNPVKVLQRLTRLSNAIPTSEEAGTVDGPATEAPLAAPTTPVIAPLNTLTQQNTLLASTDQQPIQRSSNGGISEEALTGLGLELDDDGNATGVADPTFKPALNFSDVTFTSAAAIATATAPSSADNLGVNLDPARLAALEAAQLQPAEVQQLLSRAAAASASEDAIIAVVDRNGRILGVRVEQDVLNTITDPDILVFAIDGAVAKARTAAMFSNGDPDNGTLAPLTSRTVRVLSQSTITQREIESNPNVDNGSRAEALASTVRGPGFVAPIGVGGHFPPEINFTPLVDLFGIEHTNRDTTLHPGQDGIKGTADDIDFDERFNVDSSFVPAGNQLAAPESYGAVENSGRLLDAQSRGIATLPGGIPLFRDTNADEAGDTLLGGIGVFFPGPDGFATHEQGFQRGVGQTEFARTNAPRVREAEFIAFAAAGGSFTAEQAGIEGAKSDVNVLNGVAPVAGLDLPFGRLDLVGIQLDVYGPMGSRLGAQMLLDDGETYGQGDPNSGEDQTVDGTTDNLYRSGQLAPEGWLVEPHASEDGLISQADVEQIIRNGVTAAQNVRAAVRLPLSSPTRMVFAVTDTTGEVLGLFRMQDATTFSIDVAVAKARNVAYYADANDLEPVDQLGEAGVAYTNRTFRFLSQPRFPSGINGTDPAPFSTLHDGNINQLTGENLGAPAAVGDFVDTAPDDTPSILGYDAFFPNTNFRDPGDGLNPSGSADTYHQRDDTVANQNGIVFFPGSTPLYQNGQLIGGFGVSGDGVDQDDVVTYVGATGFLPETHDITRADETLVRDIRLPYQHFLRNPFGGLGH